MTKQGKILVTVIVVLALALIASVTHNVKQENRPDFVITADRYNSHAYMFLLEDLPGGQYRIKCASGEGRLYIDETEYFFFCDKTLKDVPDYWNLGGTMFIRADSILAARGSTENEFTLEFYLLNSYT